MRTRLVLVLAVLCLALAAPAAWAQGDSSTNEKDSYRDYISPYLGLDTGGSLFKTVSPLGGLDQGNPKVYGVAIGFWGKGMLSGELDLAYHPSFFGPEGAPYLFENGTGTLGPNSLLTITGSFVINPSIDIGSQRIRPYVVIGGGLMRSSIEGFKNVFNAEPDNRGIVNVGGGIQYYPHKRIGIRADFRFNMGVGADGTGGYGWMDNWNFYRFVVGPAITF